MAFKRMIGLLLAALLCFGACAAAEETDAPQFVMAGYDSTQYRDWLNNQFFKRIAVHKPRFRKRRAHCGPHAIEHL